jgi:ribonuclease D
MYITTSEQLSSYCSQIENCDWLAIDTEFVREKSYFHHLGLIQVSGNGICAAIDPIAVKNIGCLLEIFKKKSILKVFHAGRQDLEILNRLCGIAVSPVFDTQVAASLLGWGSQISFAKIVQKTISKKIYKTETYTDWCRRPLSSNQIEYAIDDVRFLAPVYENLLEHLKKANRLEWLQDEFAPLEDPNNYELPDPQKQYMRIKNFRNLRQRNLAVLIELSSWREKEARLRDCHPRSIMRDEPLLEIARILPKDKSAMESIRGLHQREVGKSVDMILDAIERGKAIPEEDIPRAPEVRNYSTQPGVEELLAAYIQMRAIELKIEATVLADRKLIHDLVLRFEQKDPLEGNSLFYGWRKELIGKAVIEILNGEKGLVVNGKGRIRLMPTKESSSEL